MPTHKEDPCPNWNDKSMDAVARGLDSRDADKQIRAEYWKQYAFVAKRIGNPEDRDDVFNQATAQAYQSYNPSLGPFSPYWRKRLADRIKNYYRDTARAKKNVSLDSLLEAGLDFYSDYSPLDSELTGLVAYALNTLATPKYASALKLHYIQGLSLEEILAVIPDVNLPGLKMRLLRARKLFAKQHEEEFIAAGYISSKKHPKKRSPKVLSTKTQKQKKKKDH